jgi:hypothetical protein
MAKMIFNPLKDFEGIKYNVFKSDDLSDVHGIDKFTVRDRGDKLNMLRYVMALYDKKSPLIRMFTDLGQRKNEAATVAGYSLERDQHILKPFFDFTDLDLQDLVVDFLIDQGDMYWSMIVSNTNIFYEYQKALGTQIIGDGGEKDKLQSLQIKSKLMDDSERIAERVEAYMRKVFGEDQIADIARVKNFTPESVAKR